MSKVSIYCAIYFYFLTNNKCLVFLIDSVRKNIFLIFLVFTCLELTCSQMMIVVVGESLLELCYKIISVSRNPRCPQLSFPTLYEVSQTRNVILLDNDRNNIYNIRKHLIQSSYSNSPKMEAILFIL